MEFQAIEEEMKVHPGEYLLHVPSKQIVICGAFKRGEGTIKALSNGRLIEDKIDHFQKMKLSAAERKARKLRRCGGCKR